MKIEIISSIDKDLNSKIKDIVKSDKYTVNGENNNPISCAVFVIDNVTKNIIAVYSENCSNILTKKRQPGSIIKPILVYAPAIEYGLITPETIVKDEPIDINGYTPKNANKKYSGNVTVSEALQKSLNVPTVKILSNVGVNKAKSFANNLGITFDEKDQNLALALGGMTNGLTVKEIADAYSAFASYGDYAQSNIIKEIKDENGNILWKDNKVKASAMKQSTAFLITNILEGTRKNGTTRRLASFDFQIASKTGTVGSGIDNSNQEAYCVAYTSEHTIVTWFGENEKSGHLPSNVNGSTYPTMLIKDVLTFLYKDHKPNDFTIPASVVKLPLDSRSQQIYGRTELARQNMPERYKKEAYFATDNLPKESTFDLPHKTTLNVVMDEGNKPTLFFDTKKENKYIIIRDDLTTKTHAEIYSTLGTGQKHQFIDETTIKSHVYEYKVIVFNINNENEQYISNKIKLLSY